jgi:hypothetical protein
MFVAGGKAQSMVCVLVLRGVADRFLVRSLGVYVGEGGEGVLFLIGVHVVSCCSIFSHAHTAGSYRLKAIHLSSHRHILNNCTAYSCPVVSIQASYFE